MKFYRGIFFSSLLPSLTLSSNSFIQNNQENKSIVQSSTRLYNPINYYWSDTYKTWTNDSSNKYVLFDWGKNGYDDFVVFANKYRYFRFEGFLYAGIQNEGGYRLNLERNLIYRTRALFFSTPDEWNYVLISASYFKSPTYYTILNLRIWLVNDDKKIYFQWHAFFKGNTTNQISLSIRNSIFFGSKFDFI